MLGLEKVLGLSDISCEFSGICDKLLDKFASKSYPDSRGGRSL